jgi:hypothetical protein
MRAIQVSRFCGPEVLVPTEVPAAGLPWSPPLTPPTESATDKPKDSPHGTCRGPALAPHAASLSW